MADKSINEPRDLAEVRFTQLEQQVTYININCNVSLLMAEVNNKLEIFGEDGGSNGEEKLEHKSKDLGEMEKQLKKEPKKDQSSWSVVNQ